MRKKAASEAPGVTLARTLSDQDWQRICQACAAAAEANSAVPSVAEPLKKLVDAIIPVAYRGVLK
jgi:hypothetical protein